GLGGRLRPLVPRQPAGAPGGQRGGARVDPGGAGRGQAGALVVGWRAEQSNPVVPELDVLLQQRWLVVLHHLRLVLPQKGPAPDRLAAAPGLRNPALVRGRRLPAGRLPDRSASARLGAALGADPAGAAGVRAGGAVLPGGGAADRELAAAGVRLAVPGV